METNDAVDGTRKLRKSLNKFFEKPGVVYLGDYVDFL